MNEYIYNLLKNDAVLGQNPVHFLYTEDIENCIIYNTEEISNDGIKSQYRVTITVINVSLDSIEAMSAEVKKLFITLGDDTKDKILNCNLNGGSLLFNHDTEMYNKKLYFYITIRSSK